MRILLIATTIVAAMIPAASNASESTSDGARATAVVRDVGGATLGTLYLTTGNDGKLIIAGRLARLTPGFHGFHIHAIGACDPSGTTPFSSAGPHLNPGGTSHGYHAGDLPLLYVSADGRASVVVETDSARFSDIFDADGSAMVIHAAPDNYANIATRYSAAGVPGPDAATLATGDSGARVGCGVINR